MKRKTLREQFEDYFSKARVVADLSRGGSSWSADVDDYCSVETQNHWDTFQAGYRAARRKKPESDV